MCARKSKADGRRDGGRDSARGKFNVVPEEGRPDGVNQASRNGVYFFRATVFLAVFTIACLVGIALCGEATMLVLICAGVASLLAGSCVHIAQQWERVVVLRLGRFEKVKGPGLFFTVPVVEHCAMRIDQRVHATPFGAEETLTMDLVPLDVDAVLFWMVWDAEKACTEVSDFGQAVRLSAQTVLRDAIGRAAAAEVTARRSQLDRELKRVIEEKVAPWGITILSVEIRDILMPKELQEAMSIEAQAEQRRKARIALMEAEQDISDMLKDVVENYGDDERAMRLRAMHLLYEGVKDAGGAVVIPSAWGESFGEKAAKDLGKHMADSGLF